jgi:hypothetical protein
MAAAWLAPRLSGIGVGPDSAAGNYGLQGSARVVLGGSVIPRSAIQRLRGLPPHALDAHVREDGRHGEMLGRFGVALVQALLILVGSLLLFGVDWSDPAGAALIAVAFSLVGAGAGMLLGTVLGNEQQREP